jgi:YbgC/YbaW family acyl-CoA thioester hydrolase
VSEATLSVVQRRVAMADVDAAQILYFTSPYRWMEDQFTRFLADSGKPLSVLLREGLGMPVVESRAQYLAPLFLDDVVEQRLVVESTGRTSFALRCDIGRAGDAAIATAVFAAHVWAERSGPARDGAFAPAPLPDWLRTALAP